MMEAKRQKIEFEKEAKESKINPKLSNEPDSKSHKYLVNRLKKEFDETLEAMSEKDDWKIGDTISKVQAGNIMTTLGFLKTSISQ